MVSTGDSSPLSKVVANAAAFVEAQRAQVGGFKAGNPRAALGESHFQPRDANWDRQWDRSWPQSWERG